MPCALLHLEGSPATTSDPPSGQIGGHRHFNAAAPYHPSNMIPSSAGRVYVAQNITDEDSPNAVVHVGPAYAENGDEDEGANAGIMTTAPGNGGAGDDDVNALYPVRLDEIPSTMRRVLAVTGWLTLVTSPGNPSKLQLGAFFIYFIASSARRDSADAASFTERPAGLALWPGFSFPRTVLLCNSLTGRNVPRMVFSLPFPL